MPPTTVTRRRVGVSPWAGFDEAAGVPVEAPGHRLPHYSEGVRLTGVDLSPAMLAIARDRARQLGRDVTLRTGDMQALDLPDNAFDTVVCTLSLCGIPDDRRAVAEMVRVLRPGGLLLLADHIEAAVWWARAIQSLIDLATIPLAGERYRRRPIHHVYALGFTIESHRRFAVGIIEQLAAANPDRHPRPSMPASTDEPPRGVLPKVPLGRDLGR